MVRLFSNEQVVQQPVELYTIQDAVDAEDLTEDLVNKEQEIKDTLEQLELIQQVHSKLEKQSDLNDELLEQAMAEAIKHDQLKASQNAIMTGMEALNYSRIDMLCYNISIEDFESPYAALVVSQENLLNIIKEVAGRVMTLIDKTFKKLSEYSTKLKQFFVTRARLLNSLDVIIKDNEAIEFKVLGQKQAEAMGKKFNVLLRLTEGKFDFKELMDFVQAAKNNPIMENMGEIYKYLLEPDTGDDARKSIIRQALKDNDADELHRKATEMANNVKEHSQYTAIYCLSIIQNKITLYYDTVRKFDGEENVERKDKRNLGIVKDSFTAKADPVQIKEITGIHKLGDLTPIVNELRGLCKGANAYLDKLIKSNRLAYENVEKATSSMRSKSLAESFNNIVVKGMGGWAKQAASNLWNGVSIKYIPEDEDTWKMVPDPTRDALNLVRDIGCDSLYDMMNNYYKNVWYMSDMVKAIVESVEFERGKAFRDG